MVTKNFDDIATELLRFMFLSREGDKRESLLTRQGKGWFQLPSSGHEALAAFAYHLSADDYIFPAYRDRALMHARGMTIEQLARDFFARDGSSSRGRNLPGHYSSRPLNIFSITSPVGAQCLPATGAALGIKRQKTNQVVLCHIGEAATRQGEFYEAVCFAVQESLPVIFIVEDNHYGISTPTRNLTPFNLKIFNPKLLVHIDGRDAKQVFVTGGRIIAEAREGGGPRIIWCDLDRLSSHSDADDQRVYRQASELELIKTRDPIELLCTKLIEMERLDPLAWEETKREVIKEVQEVYKRIECEPSPCVESITSHLYAPEGIVLPVPSHKYQLPPANTILQAVNRALRIELDSNPKALLFGEDVEDPKGGVFGLTKGLSNAFPEKVINFPLAEATILGAAVGLSATGHRPICELQFIDFVAPGINQLVSQITNLRWRTGGEWSCPMVIYAPYGGYRSGSGMWHSQSNESWFAHAPGLRVAVPSTPQDAAGLFWSAFHDEDPSLILLPQQLLRVEMPSIPFEIVPFGKAKIVRSGSHVTVVAWGHCVRIAEEAAMQLSDEGIYATLIDLRTIVPCDLQTVAQSLRKTGRLVVVQEDMHTCGFGQNIIADLVSDLDTFLRLEQPPHLVARSDVYIPFCPSVQKALLPSVDKVIAAIQQMLM